jgi:hypothetical protein
MPWLSPTDLAAIYSCSTRTIRRKIKRGTLISKLSGGLRMVWLAEQIHTVSSHKSMVPKERDMIPLFELYEGLSILRMRFERPLEMAAWLERCAPPSPNGPFDNVYQSWRFFFDQLDFCFHQIDTLLTSYEMNPTIFRNTYRTLVTLKSYWQESGLHLQENKVEPKIPENTKTLALLNDGLAHVRRLLLLSPQPSSCETVSRSLVVQEGVVNEGSDSHAETHEDFVSQLPIPETPSIPGDKQKKSSKKGTKDGQAET